MKSFSVWRFTEIENSNQRLHKLSVVFQCEFKFLEITKVGCNKTWFFSFFAISKLWSSLDIFFWIGSFFQRVFIAWSDSVNIVFGHWNFVKVWSGEKIKFSFFFFVHRRLALTALSFFLKIILSFTENWLTLRVCWSNNIPAITTMLVLCSDYQIKEREYSCL